MSNSYQSGNTVRLTAKFKAWDGQPADMSLVKILFYNSQFIKVSEYPIALDQILPTGEYYYDYITNTTGLFYYEFYGEINGFPSLKRASFTVVSI